MSRTALILRHVSFEDLGHWKSVLESADYILEYIDNGVEELDSRDPLAPDLVIVLGGPISVNDKLDYPFLSDTQRFLSKRLELGMPTLGICLGAQMMAQALGGEVVSQPRVEIGFKALSLSSAGRLGPLRHLEGVPVLHWHGERFTLPEGATALASTDVCPVQGFSFGNTLMGLQFHPEVGSGGFERWLIGHTLELAKADISPENLRQQALLNGPLLKKAGQKLLRDWLAGFAS
ncbi:glutamine amidotransferase [Chromohalobacter canadensis]|uniref:glutamine amidotransferase n=1 Tax=Chromohalobacter canadensis TaxID=141389 RepID=UPI0021C0534A|nr:glutamine amidotransferase [Chromohalobacter canadensis]MCT8467315.1 glutamine amidotransferase [Chromohalobacter canadensis]MCT8470937.1 glutamine amidotransferase [Chromohalobacter canadensis]MCT8497812.1 glutamine amidotransferase [Chromohalobacter canadensis]